MFSGHFRVVYQLVQITPFGTERLSVRVRLTLLFVRSSGGGVSGSFIWKYSSTKLERHPYTVMVKGSSPFISTINGQLPELVRVSSAKGWFTSSSLVLTSIFLWCNGSTSDFGSEDRGSNPCRKTLIWEEVIYIAFG